MKTTIDLPAVLLDDVKAAARKRGWNVRVVFEESLRAFLENEDRQETPHRLQHTIVAGEEAPAMTFVEMLETSGINRLPE